MLWGIFLLPTFLVLPFRLFEVIGKLTLHVKDFQNILFSITILNTNCLDIPLYHQKLPAEILKSSGK